MIIKIFAKVHRLFRYQTTNLINMFLNIKTAGCRDAIHRVSVKTKGKWLDALNAMNRVSVPPGFVALFV